MKLGLSVRVFYYACFAAPWHSRRTVTVEFPEPFPTSLALLYPTRKSPSSASDGFELEGDD